MSKTISIKKFILRRVLITIPTILILIIGVFVIIHIAPGDPISYLVGEVGADPEYIERLRIEYGLNRPLHEQLFIYLSKVLRGDLGRSVILKRHVTDIILARLPMSLLLIVTAELFTFFGILIGVEAGSRVHSKLDGFLSVVSVVGYSVPFFWLAQILIVVFAVTIDLFPMGGMTSLRAHYSGFGYVLDVVWHMVLPVTTLGLIRLTRIFRVTRASILDACRSNYIIAARAKGLPERRVKYVHMLKNAFIPVITVFSTNFATAITGTVLTETVFSWPGLGRVFFLAVSARDHPLVSGLFIFSIVAVIIVNLIVDVIYVIVDPRVRYT